LKLQEIPSSVQGGRIPRSKEVILLDDLINSTYPGEEIEVTGDLAEFLPKGAKMYQELLVDGSPSEDLIL
jgi:DNA replicative helicase MCM subunit Mcm2 (Cdc46/Mcm family)